MSCAKYVGAKYVGIQRFKLHNSSHQFNYYLFHRYVEDSSVDKPKILTEANKSPRTKKKPRRVCHLQWHHRWCIIVQCLLHIKLDTFISLLHHFYKNNVISIHGYTFQGRLQNKIIRSEKNLGKQSSGINLVNFKSMILSPSLELHSPPDKTNKCVLPEQIQQRNDGRWSGYSQTILYLRYIRRV